MLSSEDSETGETHLNNYPWLLRGASFSGGWSQETVNTALVNIYKSEENKETFLLLSKGRVSYTICWWEFQKHSNTQPAEEYANSYSISG